MKILFIILLTLLEAKIMKNKHRKLLPKFV